MYNKQQVNNHLDNLLAYCESKGLDKSRLNTMVAGLRVSIATFFNVDLAGYTEACITALVHAGIRSGMEYENYSPSATTGAKPRGYDDITEIMGFMDSMMATSEATFYSSVHESLADDGVSQQYTSSLVTSWLNTWETAITNVPANMSAISDCANVHCLGNNLKILLDAPKITYVPKRADISANIYTNKKYREFIQKLNLDVYIPE